MKGGREDRELRELKKFEESGELILRTCSDQIVTTCTSR